MDRTVGNRTGIAPDRHYRAVAAMNMLRPDVPNCPTFPVKWSRAYSLNQLVSDDMSSQLDRMGQRPPISVASQ